MVRLASDQAFASNIVVKLKFFEGDTRFLLESAEKRGDAEAAVVSAEIFIIRHDGSFANPGRFRDSGAVETKQRVAKGTYWKRIGDCVSHVIGESSISFLQLTG